jgi:hypothetical protein
MLYSGRFRVEVRSHTTQIEDEGVRAKVNAKIWRAPSTSPISAVYLIEELYRFGDLNLTHGK